MKAPVLRTLDDQPLGETHLVARVRMPEGMPQWARWLEEIGFLTGEAVTVLARARPGGDPMVVRIGLSTFALRRAEAACVDVVARA